MWQQEQWTAPDEMASEYEVGDLLFGLVRMAKPRLVVETGTYQADTSRRIGHALIANGIGRLVTCDILDRGAYVDSRCAGLPVRFRQCNSLELPELKEADLVFCDSGDTNTRSAEYAKVKSGCIFVMHDTASFPDVGRFVRASDGLTLPYSRGVGILVKP